MHQFPPEKWNVGLFDVDCTNNLSEGWNHGFANWSDINHPLVHFFTNHYFLHLGIKYALYFYLIRKLVVDFLFAKAERFRYSLALTTDAL